MLVSCKFMVLLEKWPPLRSHEKLQIYKMFVKVKVFKIADEKMDAGLAHVE